MTLPDVYRAQGVLELGIIQEYYPVEDDESAEIWVQEDITELRNRLQSPYY
jgi:hypothetical protein